MKNRRKNRKQRIAAPATPAAPKLIKLDIGCGQTPRIDPATQERFKGIDLFEGADIVHDLTVFPWPVESESVEEIWCSHTLEHIPGKLRGKFMDEVYRVLIPGGKATFIVPAYCSERAVQDYTHEWPPIAPPSFFYFDRNFREANKLTHGAYSLACDFEITVTGTVDPVWAQRELGVQQQAARNYLNVVLDYQAVLVKRKPKDQ